jgi:hypothetical protein
MAISPLVHNLTEIGYTISFASPQKEQCRFMALLADPNLKQCQTVCIS